MGSPSRSFPLFFHTGFLKIAGFYFTMRSQEGIFSCGTSFYNARRIGNWGVDGEDLMLGLRSVCLRDHGQLSNHGMVSISLELALGRSR